jgi:nucleoside-diphosphate-sugar epimerase
MENNRKRILVIGGGGYVGAVLVPKLLKLGHEVTVLDTFWFGRGVFDDCSKYFDSGINNPKLFCHNGDVRNRELLGRLAKEADIIIHLACLSNDPTFDLDPGLGRSINLDAYVSFIDIIKETKRCYGKPDFLIYASSSSVYGVKDEEHVTEDLFLDPLTDYSRFKALCESYMEKCLPVTLIPWVIIRPATVCGWSPRLRLDLTVNILTAHAYFKRKIQVFGGSQKRPNIHIDDMTDLYVDIALKPNRHIVGQIFNAGWENFTVLEIAQMVQARIGEDVQIDIVRTNDNRSYHVSSDKLKLCYSWRPKKTIEDAVGDLVNAFESGRVSDMDNPVYYNIKTMKQLKVE